MAQASADPVFNELRDEVRLRIGRVPKGTVLIHHRNHRQPVRAVRDCSARGVGLFVDEALLPGEPVRIELNRDGASRMTFYAYVAWCKSTQGVGGSAGVARDAASADRAGDGLAAPGACVAGLRVVGAASIGSLMVC
jgi:hypothetical protein